MNDLVKMGKEFKNGPSKICGRQPLKNLSCKNGTKSDKASPLIYLICWVMQA